MKVLMLGWEYPPHIAGGLGTACEGLSKGLARQGVDLTFVVPQVFGQENAEHMRLIDPYFAFGEGGKTFLRPGESTLSEEVERIQVSSSLLPYFTEEQYEDYVRRLSALGEGQLLFEAGNPASLGEGRLSSPKERYGRDIFQEVERYTHQVLASVRGLQFDVIHAHDWMTFPAGVALSQNSGKPLVVHVHSLEYDRSGENVNPRIDSLEKLGVTNADAVIAVSQYTKGIIERQHHIEADKIHVVHNGIYSKSASEHYKRKKKNQAPLVLFLGRVTFQKGPEYLIKAAAKVIPHVPNVTFAIAGTGDLLPGLMEEVKRLGIEDQFRFTGFLREKEVEEIFSAADLYVMPSVSEPFGISALEAIDFETPAIISKQSGVSEVLGNSLKFDFWDVDRFADLILNGLLHDELREDLVTMAREELKHLRWDASASRTVNVYKHLTN